MIDLHHLVRRAAMLVAGVFLVAGMQAQAADPVGGQAAKPARAAASTSKKAAAPAVGKPVFEQRALDLLKAMSDRLMAARSLSFTAQVTYEHPSRLGPPLAFMTISEVLMQRPDKLRVLTLGDGPASEFYLDGRTMTAFSPAENFVAVTAAPATIDEALKVAFRDAGIYFPFADVLLADPYANLAAGLGTAFVVGQSKVVGGTTTQVVAFANNEVFMQLWIGAEDKLPRMLRAVYRRDPLRQRHQMELSNWKVDPVVTASDFTTAKAASAVAIPFAHPAAKPAAAAAARSQ